MRDLVGERRDGAQRVQRDPGLFQVGGRRGVERCPKRAEPLGCAGHGFEHPGQHAQPIAGLCALHSPVDAAEHRVEGLRDEARPGAPRTVEDARIETLITATLESVPPGATHWSSRGMARASGLSVSTVQRVWRAFGLQPPRMETFKLSTDPDSACPDGRNPRRLLGAEPDG